MSSETTIVTDYAHIVRTAGTAGGEPRIAGRRIRVRDIVAARDLGGYSPEEIVGTVYPGLTLAEVYSALAYFEDHRQEMELAIQAEERLIQQYQERLANSTPPRAG